MHSDSKNTTDGKKESIVLVQDITKQLITLGSGFLALSATFLNMIVGNQPVSICLIIISWILIALSIVAGLFTLSSLVNLLKNNRYEPFASQTIVPAIIQWIFFILGIVLFLWFVTTNLN